MAQKTKQILKSYFETGDIPTQGNYVNLIDSLAVLQNDHNSGSLTLSGSLYISGSSYIDGNITSSGNISASGNLIVNNITSSGNISSSGTGDNYFGGKINLLSATAADQKITFGDGTQNIQGSTDYLIINGDNSIHLRADTKIHMSSSKVGIGHAFHDSGNSPSANFHISGSGASEETLIVEGSDGTDYLTVGLGGHITASGNISASGTIYANNFQSAGGDVAGISFTDDLVLTGHLTASGNISASGNVIANEANILSHISASGDIVTGGNLYIESDKYIIFAGENNSNTSIRENGGNLNIEAFGHLNIFPDHDFKIHSGSTLYATFDGQTQGLQLGSTNTTPPETLTVEGSISGSGNLKIDGSQVDFTNLPTSDPLVAGRLYNDSGTVKISL